VSDIACHKNLVTKFIGKYYDSLLTALLADFFSADGGSQDKFLYSFVCGEQ